MKKIVLAIIITLFTSTAFAGSGCTEYAYNKVFPKSKESVTIVCKAGFAVGYSIPKKRPVWVAHRIDPQQLAAATISKRPSFHRDDEIPLDAQPASSDFSGSGYEKGHLVPFEDMSYSAQSAYDVMSFIQIVPQNMTNNRGAWKSLEEAARKQGNQGVVFIVSGPIYTGKVDFLNRSKESSPVPTALFKVVINATARTSTTWIIPNAPVATTELRSMRTTRAEVAKRAGVTPAPYARLTDQL